VSEDIKQKVDINSPEFKAGVEAGLNSKAATENWQAGVELGHKLKDQSENPEIVPAIPLKEPSVPLFLKDGPDGNKENLQDEKDGTEE
jgi:hypothetical protein